MDLPEFVLARAVDREREAPDVHRAGCAAFVDDEIGSGYIRSACDCGEPARVLAECAAKRAIVAEHATQNVPVLEVKGEVVMSGPQCRTCGDWEAEDMDGAPNAPAPCRTVLLLAQPSAGHPDFDPAWRVTPCG